MFLLNMNVSLASFNTKTIKLVYLDPYNNTFGEEDWFVVFCTAILCILSIILMFSMLGIVMFVQYGIEDTENRKLLDELISMLPAFNSFAHLRRIGATTMFDMTAL